jgi:hypothetical protein
MTQKYIALKDHDTPIKVLFTGYLCSVAVGYFFALIQILFTHGMADGKLGLSIDDIVYSYYGNRSGTVLEKKLNGSMKQNASEKERFDIMQWVRDGAEIKTYESSGVKKIIDERCVMCHNKEAGTIPDFSDVEVLKTVTTEDQGATFASLTRVSHIHLFGISFIFMFVGIIFSFAQSPTMQYKCLAIGMPYVFLLVDILSWWLTKIHPMFAVLVILAGMGMGVSFMFMWVISILEMWFYPQVFINKSSGEPRRQLSEVVLEKLEFLGCDKNATLFKNGVCLTKSALLFVLDIWQNVILPFVKAKLNKKP